MRAVVGNAEEASGIKGPNVELAVGDFDRTETLDTALRNIDKAFLLTPAAERFVQWQVAFIEAFFLVRYHFLGFQHPSKVEDLRAGDEKIVWRITHIPRKRSK